MAAAVFQSQFRERCVLVEGCWFPKPAQPRSAADPRVETLRTQVARWQIDDPTASVSRP